MTENIKAITTRGKADTWPVQEDGLVERTVAWLEDFAGADLDDIAADGGVTSGMVFQQEARAVVAPRLRAALSARRSASQSDASPPLVGVEGLRELSEKATQGEWSVDDCTNIGEGYWIMAPDAEGWRGSLAAVRAGCAEMADLADDKDNAAFIVACVNHVREALVSGDAR